MSTLNFTHKKKWFTKYKTIRVRACPYCGQEPLLTKDYYSKTVMCVNSNCYSYDAVVCSLSDSDEVVWKMWNKHVKERRHQMRHPKKVKTNSKFNKEV